MKPASFPPLATLSLALCLAALASACTDTQSVTAAQAQPASVEPAATPAVATDAQPAAAPIAAQSGTYAIDPAHTMILAQWNHMGFSNPSANFAGATGTIVYDADNPTASSVKVDIPLSGITSFTPDFDKHLASADFFEVAKFPNATFASTAVKALGNNRLQVTGDLTIKGFDATAGIQRSDWGLGYAAPAVSDAVQLRITTEAQLQ